MIFARRAGWLGGAASAALVLLAATAGAEQRGRPFHHGHVRRLPFNPFDDYGLAPPPYIFEEPPPSGYPPIFNFPEDEGPLVVEPTPRPDATPYPYPQGFSLDVPTPTDDGGSPRAKQAGPLNRYRDVADALARCWRPPATIAGIRWNTVTLRVSFKRDGSINGLPRIPYADPGLTPDARSSLNQSLTAALHRCTPLDLTPGLGSAIAGQIFALRFLEQDP
ncbi:hypothetical protein [Lichenifustis flavocetrariae]|uniref:TonB C-terminal domain-containing protein n=1 Tax=Lichenifustis flavocetrariae TaxID=2949735 RepID=A0AA42CLJ7_9HYPH|nr:hypothetical protein [Lichenifustis flavocetrariae]MCW6510471.1 hypothetical protein [Lichenifustis flavocetrariae]